MRCLDKQKDIAFNSYAPMTVSKYIEQQLRGYEGKEHNLPYLCGRGHIPI